MTKSPRVSVIIPAYNGERFIAQAIASALDQPGHAVELIVVDDGSTDGTGEVVARFPQVRYLRQANAGVGATRNHGLALSTSEFVTFLDQDDLVTPTKLETQLAYLDAHPECAMVTGHLTVFLESGVARPTWAPAWWFESSFPAYYLGAILARRALFDTVGKFETRYQVAGDSDWFFRVKDAGFAVPVLPDVMLKRRIHDANESRRPGGAELVRMARHSIQRQRGGARHQGEAA